MTDNVSEVELRSFVDRIEAQEARMADEAETRKEIYAEATARGYDAKTLRKIVALRKKSPDEIAEAEAVLELYKAALGMV